MANGNPRVLVAGIGNIFLGDDAFGVEVAKRLLASDVPPGVRVVDVGIRSLHLAYDLVEAGCETVILIDVVRRGGTPGTLYVLEPDDIPDDPETADGHSIGPGQVLALLQRLGGGVDRMLIVGCEPLRVDAEPGLSPIVSAAVLEAVPLVLRLAAEAAIDSAVPAGGSI